MDRELTNYWAQVKPGQQVIAENGQFKEAGSYEPGIALRIQPTSYQNFTHTATPFVHNPFLNTIIDSFYGSPNNKFMQIFAYHDTRLRDENWDDAINNSSALHFDGWQSLKFATYLTHTSQENGMTRFIPGSHVEGKKLREAQSEPIFPDIRDFPESDYTETDAIYPAVGAGDLVIFDTDCWHGGGEILVEGRDRKCIICHSRQR